MSADRFERLCARLRARPDVSDWRARHRLEQEAQLYVIGGRAEATRVVEGDRFDVVVYVDREGRRGASAVTLYPGAEDEWDARLRDAAFRARLQANPPFELPGPQRYARVALVDPAIRDGGADAARALVDRLLGAVARERQVRLSSAEAYLTHARLRFANSRGASGESAETNAELEFVLLAGDGVDGTEAYRTLRRRRLADLAIEAEASLAAKFARDSLRATAPTAGRTAVVFSGDPLGAGSLSDFWDPLRFHSSAQSAYRKLARFTPGAGVPAGRVSGERLTLAIDPRAPYGPASAPFDPDGLALRRLTLIEDGRLVRYWATKEYADYLRIEPTGPITNLVLPPGRTAERDLMAEGPTLQVVFFSWFNPDPVTGDFATEIRLGYERRHGQERPVKGGAVQGNLFDALRRATFARERAWIGAYHGPRSLRCERLTVGAA